MIQARRKLLGILVLFCLVLILAACKSEKETAVEEEPEEQEDPIVVEEPEPEPEPEEPKVTYPLSGVEAEDDEVNMNYRALGVMVENSVSARPQSGIYQADVVYEILSEGTITRFLALFHSQQPERIGPVRSARSYYVHLNKGYDAIYSNAGGSPGGLQLAQSDYVDDISGLAYDGRYFTRSSDRVAPHNLYTSYEDLLAAVEHRGYEMDRQPPELYFEEEPDLSDGEEAIGIEINYGSTTNNVQFEYDEALKKYRRFNGGEPSVDLETGEPVAPKNLFIVEASHRVIPSGENHIDAGSNRREVDVESGGRAYLLQEGIVQEVEWQNIDGQILPFKDGEQLPFLPGQTWINFVPSSDNGLDSKVMFYDIEQ